MYINLIKLQKYYAHKKSGCTKNVEQQKSRSISC